MIANVCNRPGTKRRSILHSRMFFTRSAAATALFLATIFFMGPPVSGQGDDTMRQPHIVFVMSDDLGYRDMGYMGSDIYTPTLNRLAASGVKLDNYYVQPSCSPTRSQLFSGRYQIHMGIQHGTFHTCQLDGLPLEYPTLADVMKDAGYATHAIGKWHLGFSQKEYTPLYRGFDTFYGIYPGFSDHYTYTTCDPSFENASIFTLTNDFGVCGYSLIDQDTPAFSENGTYSTHTYTERATRIIQDASKSEKPLFLYLAYQAPRAPVEAPPHYYENYDNILNSMRREYAGMMSAMDEGVATVTQALRDAGLWDNTIFIFSNDNGGHAADAGINWPLRGDKDSYWEGGIRTLGFVTSPLLGDERQGEISRELMHVTDWLPTLAAMAGKTLNDSLSLDGMSQWDMIRYGSASPRSEILHNIDELYAQKGSPLYEDTFDTRIQASLRLGDYKILTGDPGDGTWFQIPDEAGYGYTDLSTTNDWNAGSEQNVWLFNIATDPNEIQDLSELMPDKVREMLDRLAEYAVNMAPIRPIVNDPKCDPAYNGGAWLPWVDSSDV